MIRGPNQLIDEYFGDMTGCVTIVVGGEPMTTAGQLSLSVYTIRRAAGSSNEYEHHSPKQAEWQPCLDMRLIEDVDD